MQADQIFIQFNSACKLFLWDEFIYSRSLTENKIFMDTLALFVQRKEPSATTHASPGTFQKFVTAIYNIICHKSTRLEDFPVKKAILVLRNSLQPTFVPPPVPRITGGFGTPAQPPIDPCQPEFESSVFHLL